MVYHFVHIQEGQWYRPYLFFRVSSSFWTIHKKSLPDEGHGSVKAVHHFLSWYSKFFHVSNHSNDPDEKKEFVPAAAARNRKCLMFFFIYNDPLVLLSKFIIDEILFLYNSNLKKKIRLFFCKKLV